MRELVAAVRRRDVEEVTALLESGAGPGTLADGLPVLCLAVAAYDRPVAEALLQAGADPLRRLPDGSTPLTRAVDGGSHLLTSALATSRIPLPAPARAELLARARRWAEAGTEAELRRITGHTGPVERIRVEDDEVGWWSEQLTLGGTTVRDEHRAVLTSTEERYGIRAPFDELVDRALAHPDRNHVVWSVVVFTLGRRLDEETWQWTRDLLNHPDRLYRLLAADILLFLILGDFVTGRDPFRNRGRELVPWAELEEDPEVLAVILQAMTHDSAPEIEAVGLSHLAHPDPRVRALVPDALGHSEDGRSRVSPQSLTAVLTLARDEDPGVREAACRWLGHYRGNEPEAGDALVALTHDERQQIRICAVSGLAYRDDPRCVEAEHRIGPVDAELPFDERLLDVWRYQRRQEATERS
ncbi:MULTISPECIES: HEAT repeat domain-containing protein [Streptomyces]|uniref:Putative lyase n=1 Tax=Streptomyces chartreusis NRRL 3882 TaxID=1079985 RepID=A0A2N9BD25_STRCX|nr:HEAT repeat domain-containing protein [Streptomyces chartreusis]SOR81266.1 putative lyase [Streptomyces chartreusis NRRL 3882]